MSDVTVAESAAVEAAEAAEIADERLAYRGVFQRLFIRPEIGALIGVVGDLGVLLGGGRPVRHRQRRLEPDRLSPSTLGIMAVAVSMLMIGGEFDLSAGAMTGCDGHPRRSCSSKEAGEFGGAGLSLWIAIPLSLAVAMGIGYMNGLLVEKTKLPSFTITLGTYYVLRRRQARLLEADRRPDPGRRHRRG